MNHTPAGLQRDQGQYQIRLNGHLAPRWTSWFPGMNLSWESDGTTVLEGPVVDQAALHGLLTKLRDIGLPLISVTQVQPHPSPPPATPQGD